MVKKYFSSLISHLSSPQGQTLLEVLVAFSVAIVVISAVTTAVLSSLKTTQESRNQNIATQFAQEGMETIRKLRDTGGLFSKATGTYCLGSSLQLPQQTVALVKDCNQDYALEGNYIRAVVLTIAGVSSECFPTPPPPPIPTPIAFGNAMKVDVSVRWADSSCGAGTADPYCRHVTLTSCFVDTNVIPIP